MKDVTFYHQDALGSVVMLTGHNGQVVERYEYDVYGVAYNGKFDHGLAGMGGNPYGFTGKWYEPEMGVYSFAFRDYNPQNMQWMTEDPVKDGFNWYQYCLSNPVNFIDRLGLDVIVLNDSDAVNLPGGPYGHNAVLVGNEETGYDYYSKGGKVPNQEIDNNRMATENGNFKEHYDSLEKFKEDTAVSGRYDRSATIQTKKEQDATMKQKADEIYDNPYDFVNNNCADLVEDVAAAGGVDLSGSDITVPVPIPTSNGPIIVPVTATVPNKQYKKAKEIEEDQCPNS